MSKRTLPRLQNSNYGIPFYHHLLRRKINKRWHLINEQIQWVQVYIGYSPYPIKRIRDIRFHNRYMLPFDKECLKEILDILNDCYNLSLAEVLLHDVPNVRWIGEQFVKEVGYNASGEYIIQ